MQCWLPVTLTRFNLRVPLLLTVNRLLALSTIRVFSNAPSKRFFTAVFSRNMLFIHDVRHACRQPDKRRFHPPGRRNSIIFSRWLYWWTTTAVASSRFCRSQVITKCDWGSRQGHLLTSETSDCICAWPPHMAQTLETVSHSCFARDSISLELTSQSFHTAISHAASYCAAQSLRWVWAETPTAAHQSCDISRDSMVMRSYIAWLVCPLTRFTDDGPVSSRKIPRRESERERLERTFSQEESMHMKLYIGVRLSEAQARRSNIGSSSFRQICRKVRKFEAIGRIYRCLLGGRNELESRSLKHLLAMETNISDAAGIHCGPGPSRVPVTC